MNVNLERNIIPRMGRQSASSFDCADDCAKTSRSVNRQPIPSEFGSNSQKCRTPLADWNLTQSVYRFNVNTLNAGKKQTGGALNCHLRKGAVPPTVNNSSVLFYRPDIIWNCVYTEARIWCIYSSSAQFTEHQIRMDVSISNAFA